MASPLTETMACSLQHLIVNGYITTFGAMQPQAKLAARKKWEKETASIISQAS